MQEVQGVPSNTHTSRSNIVTAAKARPPLDSLTLAV